MNNVALRLGLLELLCGTVGVQYVIPAYQLNYTWTANHEVKHLVENIKAKKAGSIVLPSSASVLLQMVHNGWEWWTLENGMTIDDSMRKK